MSLDTTPNSITHDFRDFDADDSSAQIHQVEPASDDELEREIDGFSQIFTAPQRKRGDA